MRIVHFGAGNIGRGAIPEIFNGLYDHITFVDPFIGIINKLNATKSYVIKNAQPVKVSHYDAILMTDYNEVLKALNQADVISTACGFDNLSAVADLLNQIHSNKKIHVICFENNVRPTTHLKTFLKHPENFILLDCTIDRVVPKQATSDDNLDLITEDYLKVIIEEVPQMHKHFFSNCEIVPDLTNYISLKLFAVNGLHFLLAILTHNHGYKYIHEYSKDKTIINIMQTYMQLLSTFLCDKYDFEQLYVQDFIQHNLERFSNALLNDECTRVARNAMLKLKADNRIIPVLRYFLEKEMKTDVIQIILEEVFSYRNPDDADANNIQSYLNTHTLDETIYNFSQLKTNITKK